MEMIRLDDESYTYLIQIISEKYYQTTDIEELKKKAQIQVGNMAIKIKILMAFSQNKIPQTKR